MKQDVFFVFDAERALLGYEVGADWEEASDAAANEDRYPFDEGHLTLVNARTGELREV